MKTDDASQSALPADPPLVSCIMPTADRPAFARRAVEYFKRQNYPRLELVIVDDGREPVDALVAMDPRIRYVRLETRTNLGRKRNIACVAASGSIIAHWDDDDWYAPWRVRDQVAGMLGDGRELSGSQRVLFFEPATRRAWRYVLPDPSRAWLAGGTLCYTKALWEGRPFPDADTGEDSLFVGAGPCRAFVPREDWYVGIVHARNASPKLFTDRGWERVPVGAVLELLRDDSAFYRSLQEDASRARRAPLVSCLMPTRDRRHFAAQAIKYFQAQDYPNRELVIVDDGADPVGDLAADEGNIRYFRLARPRSIGAKRNLACEAARGDVFVQWDDDDWHGPDRLAYQLLDLILGTADATGLVQGMLLDLASGRFLACRSDVPSIMHPLCRGIHCATLAFTRETWLRVGGYPDSSSGEDLTFYLTAVDRGARVIPLPNLGTFVYVRHSSNSWRFAPADFGGADAWTDAPPPDALRPKDLAFYLSFAARTSAAASLVPATA